VVHKERETWSDDEHSKFLQAIERHGRDWKLIEQAVGTKTLSQIRSHAQKYFGKVQNQGNPTSKNFDLRKGNALIDVPWIALPDVMKDKKFLLNREGLGSWMLQNGLRKESPPAVAPDFAPTTISALIETQKVQAQMFFNAAVGTLPKSIGNGEEEGIDWTKLFKYVGDSVSTAPGRVTFEDLNSKERGVLKTIMTQIIAATSVESVRDKLELFLKAFREVPAASSQPGENMTNSMELIANFVMESRGGNDVSRTSPAQTQAGASSILAVPNDQNAAHQFKTSVEGEKLYD